MRTRTVNQVVTKRTANEVVVYTSWHHVIYTTADIVDVNISEYYCS